MASSWFLTNLLAAFLLPPFNLLLLGLLGWLLLGHRNKLGKMLLGISLAGIWLLATPAVSDLLMEGLTPAPHALSGKEADVIVVLGGGRNRDSIEYGGDTLSRFSIERVRYGAWLAKRLHKPLLVTGGTPGGGNLSEGEIMGNALRDEFGVPARWVETRSNNTRENARYSAAMLREAGIRRIYLVTHAWHLARAVPEFEAEGIQVVPAGTGYSLPEARSVFDFLPKAGALNQSNLAMHEWIGLLWYRIRN